MKWKIFAADRALVFVVFGMHLNEQATIICFVPQQSTVLCLGELMFVRVTFLNAASLKIVSFDPVALKWLSHVLRF